jgi:O-antigen/teichoic acid export membrane protein
VKQNKLAIKNAISGSLMQLVKILLNFIVRTVFIRTLGEQAVGLNGLFTNILSIMSLSELGFGAAVVTHMYQPLAQNDNKRVFELMKIYKTIYIFVGIAISMVGIVLLPFLPSLTKTYTGLLNVQILFVLYLLNVALTYFLGYKTSILTADQLGYIVSNSYAFMLIGQSIIQVFILVLLKSFYIYLVVAVVATILQNCFVWHAVNKHYPYVAHIKGFASFKDMKSVTDYVKPLLVYQISGVINTSTDSIVISQWLSISVTGLYSNYMMILNALLALVTALISSVTATIGNIVYSKPHRLFNSFKRLFGLSAGIAAFVAICSSALLKPFVSIWLGDAYVFDWNVSAIFAINIYVTILGLPLMVFREATGSFVHRQFIPLISVFLNLGLSILLVERIGIAGVIMGTLFGRLLTYTWNDPSVIFKYHFKQAAAGFIFRQYVEIILMSFLIAALAWLTALNSHYTFLNFTLLIFVVVPFSILVALGRTLRIISASDLRHGRIFK